MLLISDEVICSWGRLGYYFGAERYGYSPDIITTAKGLTSAYAPMGALIASDKVADPFIEGTTMFAHGLTFGGHPMAAAIALANLDIFEREDLCGHVREKEAEFREMLEGLKRDLADRRRRARRRLLPGDRAGQGPGDEGVVQRTRSPRALLRGFLSAALYDDGLICRADDRGDPVIQLSPAADRGHRRVRRDRPDPAQGADRRLGAPPFRGL